MKIIIGKKSQNKLITLIIKLCRDKNGFISKILYIKKKKIFKNNIRSQTKINAQFFLIISNFFNLKF